MRIAFHTQHTKSVCFYKYNSIKCCVLVLTSLLYWCVELSGIVTMVRDASVQGPKILCQNPTQRLCPNTFFEACSTCRCHLLFCFFSSHTKVLLYCNCAVAVFVDIFVHTVFCDCYKYLLATLLVALSSYCYL